MADARIKGEWLNAMRFDALSDESWRVFTGALMWSAENGTDGVIPKRYLRMLHPDGEQPAAFNEMEVAGLWAATNDGYHLDDWDGALGQSTASQVATYKANGLKRARDYRERERSKLAKALGMSEPTFTENVTRDVTRDVRPHVGKGKGEGKGKGSGDKEVLETKELNINTVTGEVEDEPMPVTSWPVVAIPVSDPGYCSHGMTVGKRCSSCARERKAS
ncbi:hypothetical protein FB472_1954 [Rhodoglobus vestalii]|uniref:Uncharacterized protein n=1 Tax=Rhodoglobus vestalii TaxID=193384 RepID=A0A8H2K5Q8_9MICO|nr:hypothetical protein [Rhodoglobus vestalii]TQO20323.1 hypothetical protein FB472_1954 [Rhodoglobus vestalii]